MSGPLSAPRSTASNGNGRIVYSKAGGFPSTWFDDTNFWVDVNFTASANAPATLTASTPAADATGVATNVQPTATFSKALNSTGLTFTLVPDGGAAVPGTTTYNATTKTVTFTPSAALSAAKHYTATVSGTDTGGNAGHRQLGLHHRRGFDRLPALRRPTPNRRRPRSPTRTPSNWACSSCPSTNGQVIGVRYYQGAGNTGTHIGNLWSSTGTNLATVTFPSNTSTGWQTALFSTPVTVTAGTTYVASYHAPNGHYASTGNYFTTAVNQRAAERAGDDQRRLQVRGGQCASRPTAYQATNYWVDPLFTSSGGGTDPTPSPTVSPTASPTPRRQRPRPRRRPRRRPRPTRRRASSRRRRCRPTSTGTTRPRSTWG